MMEQFLEFLLTNRDALLLRTGEHLELMAFSLLAAIALGLPAGALASRLPRLRMPLITMANIVQTIPSVALLGFLIPAFGIGKFTAISALILYALLPIVRNTISGITSVDPAIVDAARGMGMNGRHILLGIEAPLAMPVIFAGIRTAAVINVGVTTLSALVGAGGLGTFIFRGLGTSNTNVILLGALPAALLALFADAWLGTCERAFRKSSLRGWVAVSCIAIPALAFWALAQAASTTRPGSQTLRFGFTSEFMVRADGYPGWRNHYGFPKLHTKELDPGLLYDALRHGRVDVACGFSTDGRITLFDLKSLSDDKRFFPNYAAAILCRENSLTKSPGLRDLLVRLENAIDTATMRQLNLSVDQEKQLPADVATQFLVEWTARNGINWNKTRAANKVTSGARPDLVIGAKNFTEQYILGQIITRLINGGSEYTAAFKSGLGGTAICLQALRRGDIDLYPEYSGTLLTSVPVLADIPKQAAPHDLNAQISSRLSENESLVWFAPFGFENTYAILVSATDSRFSEIQRTSDLLQLMGDLNKP